ncbi:MAG TPA: response regulator transcription factor [Gaiellaceae bacterium]|jgi:two-component system response regulator RegX3|nr:response regulator transcription factor [Gaiellaceae bacterium]
MSRILIVDDEPAIVDAVGYALRTEGFETDAADDGERALDAAANGTYDLVLLDLNLPGISGIEVCRRLRESSEVPVIMLTARDSEVDLVLGLEVGADDYVKKPFSMTELISRVRATLRRRSLDLEGDTSRRTVGDLEIDAVRHEVVVNGRSVSLTPSEFKLLARLAEHPGRVFTRRELMQHLWDSDYVGDERACDSHMANLRRKLERDPARPARLVSVRGVGYKLAAL